MVSAVITEIENWYREPASDPTRSTLLSKLAIIELCGWLEEWMDEVIRAVDKATLKDAEWTARRIDSTFGFHYEKHFRVMLCAILGEHKIREVEKKFESSNVGDLEFIRSTLGGLWVTRCKLTHSDLATHRAAQVTVNAPSWTKNQFRLLSKRLDDFKTCLLSAI
jgi:2-iminobutanoate/2-iminopropanoate deaminase